MNNYYSSNPTFYVSVDCIIFGFNEDGLSLLLLKRNFEPAKGEWSLMGGFIQQNESADEAAKRILAELTGLQDVYMEQVYTFGEIHRDPGERVISIAYYALININEYDRELVQKHNAYWMNINELPPLIFAHPQMVEKAQEMMRTQASTEPIGFNLLPKLFTLSQLQSLYEAIYGEPIDKRNFRKRVAEIHGTHFLPLCRTDFRFMPCAVITDAPADGQILLVKVDVLPCQTCHFPKPKTCEIGYLNGQNSVFAPFGKLRQKFLIQFIGQRFHFAIFRIFFCE